MTRKEALERVSRWYQERERAMNPTHTHPVTAVRELALSDSAKRGSGVYTAGGKESRPPGRSQAPIRDMNYEARETEHFLKHVREVYPNYYQALEYWARRGMVKDIAKGLRVSRFLAYCYLEGGIAILMSKMRN